MKTQFTFFMLIFALVLAACTPAAPIQPERATGTPPSLSSAQDDQTETEGDFPRPEVAWNHDPNTLIISGTFCCGFTTPLVPLNYIPDFQVWGDGRYVWVVYSSDNTSRQVMQGQLTEEQLTTLLQKMVDTGFFGWEDRYANEMVADLADKCMTVHLESASKTVCEYAEGAPEAFHTFYNNFAKGNEVAGTEYLPTQGFLTAIEYGRLARPISEDDIIWPNEKLFSLATVVEEGQWVEGEALLLAWQAVNKDPWGGTVTDGTVFYGVAIQIPGLSMNQPVVKAP